MLLKDRLVFQAAHGSLVVSPDRVNPTRRQATRCSMIFTYHVAKLSICKALKPELRQNVSVVANQREHYRHRARMHVAGVGHQGRQQTDCESSSAQQQIAAALASGHIDVVPD